MDGGEKPRDGPDTASAAMDDGRAKRRFDWKALLGNRNNTSTRQHGGSGDTSDTEQSSAEKRPARWNMGIMNAETDEVPGSVLLLSKVSEYNEPLGIRNAPARTSASSLPYSPSRSSSQQRRRSSIQEKKRTPDGQFVLDPQPDDSLNDPLNWSKWRRDAALLSLGFYCMLGGGMTAILAAGFNNVAHEYDVSEPTVALTTGLYMMGLGIGSVLLSPTAILYGKRPVYLVASVAFALSGVWCALSPSFGSLVGARIFMGVAASSVECLPSATIAEIYFLHEKGYRLGIYTLLLLGGKNLVPLVSAAVIESLGWRWVFWIVAIVVAFGGVLLFLFVPETFWDRTPKPRRPKPRQHGSTWSVHQVWHQLSHSQPASPGVERKTRLLAANANDGLIDGPATEHKTPGRHAHFQTESLNDEKRGSSVDNGENEKGDATPLERGRVSPKSHPSIPPPAPAVAAHDYFDNHAVDLPAVESQLPHVLSRTSTNHSEDHDPRNAYTQRLDSEPAQTWVQSLKPYAGRLSKDNWFKVALRPFILFAYPSLLWSALVYSLSIGWLIVISESITTIYKDRNMYNFTSLQAGLVYISPFVGGVLGTAVAGKFSDIVVRYMARKNGGIYEPEFRLVMAIPIAITTVIGLMGYGWSAEERDAWIVPTVFFGIISFGCSLGSTTSITFAVDSYRQYAGEALVTLNFSKNIFHGLAFSLFFNDWLDSEGSKSVFLAIGGIQLACLFTTIPMYIYGKRARMWTARKNLMEKF
ncbi:MFS antiporter QDR3 [Fulvia fulva]|nr:MFS antiporter QDR3 [Fulvia fulva]